MRILFLHEVNYLSKPIFEMHEFPEHLARLGHEVGFVHFPEGYSQSQIRDLGFLRRISGRVFDGVQLDLFTPWTFNGGLFGRLFTAKVSYWQFKRILREYQPDVVVSFSVPTSGWQALLASNKAKVPYVFRALDVSHDIRRSPFSPFVKAAERFIYSRADAVSANSPAMLKYCRGSGRLNAQSAVHFPPLNLELFEHGNRHSGRESLGLAETTKVVLYLGSFFYFSGLETVIRELKAHSNSIRLVLVGAGEQDGKLRSLVSELNLQGQVIFTGMVPYAALPDLVAAADVAINPMERTAVSNFALPNKVLQYMASGIPVVSTRLDGLVSTLGPDSGVTWGDTPQEVARLAWELLYNPGLASMSQRARDAIHAFAQRADPEVFSGFLQRVRISK